MVPHSISRSRLTPEVCVRAIEARDPRFDGVFFVGITSTRIYCRPICPARVSRPDHRRFFHCAAAAESAGFRPCRRCRPELAPGRALVDAVSRLAFAAERRIAEGALNGRPVRALARELCVGERHLRRALERELGVSPIQLAQTHRLLLAKRLLTDTRLPVAQVAYASGFQSLRRFNALFRDSYGMSPSTLRRRPRSRRTGHAAAPGAAPSGSADPYLTISLAYRTPFNWAALIRALQEDSLPEVEQVSEARYARTVSIEGHAGVIIVGNEPGNGGKPRSEGCLSVEISPSLLPALMPLIARLRHVFDLDAEPAVIEGALEGAGLGPLVRRFPGTRLPGAFDGFEQGLTLLLRPSSSAGRRTPELLRSVVTRLGEPVGTGIPGLEYLSPRPERVAAAGEDTFLELGVPRLRARAITGLARSILEGSLHLRPGSDPAETLAKLVAIPGFDEPLAKRLIGRSLGWPDTFDSSDAELQRATGTSSASLLEAQAERWRPWSAYAALLHRMSDARGPASIPRS